jgi:asparagine synthase (glutamine-hydrolysing)
MIPQTVKGKSASYFLSQNREYVGAYLSIWTKNERQKRLMNSDLTVDYANASELYKEKILQRGIKNDFITNLQYLDLQTYMVDDILTKVDRASMLNSLEVRVPLLDHKFAELSFKIPWNLKFKGKEQKYILKEAMKPYLPPSILNHQKQGFGVPISMWFKDNLRTYVNDTLNSENCLLYKYLDKRYVQRTMSNNLKGMRDFSSKIWSLLVFNEWLQQNK